MNIKGVNLGNWLVLEKWMSPALFEGTTAEDEYYLPTQLSPEAYEARKKINRSMLAIRVPRAPRFSRLFILHRPFFSGTSRGTGGFLWWGCGGRLRPRSLRPSIPDNVVDRGARRPGDVCSARTEAERRPLDVRGTSV